MLRRAILILLLLAAPAAAMPGDEAELLVLGFSADGRYFAYAQSGREPKTWYPYASVHAIDVTTDKWLPDSPTSLVLKDREKTTRDARREVGETAPEKRWGRLGLDTPGVTLLERKPGEPIDKGDEVEVTIPSIGPARVRLTPKLLPAEGCEGFAGESVGVVLDILTFEGARIRRLQEDSPHSVHPRLPDRLRHRRGGGAGAQGQGAGDRGGVRGVQGRRHRHRPPLPGRHRRPGEEVDRPGHAIGADGWPPRP